MTRISLHQREIKNGKKRRIGEYRIFITKYFVLVPVQRKEIIAGNPYLFFHFGQLFFRQRSHRVYRRPARFVLLAPVPAKKFKPVNIFCIFMETVKAQFILHP